LEDPVGIVLHEGVPFLKFHSKGSASAFAGAAAAGVIYQDLAHQLSRQPPEMTAILPLDRFAADNPDKYFVYQGRWLECVIAALAAHLKLGDPLELRKHDFGKLISSGKIPLAEAL
jgi:hypothetical protein